MKPPKSAAPATPAAPGPLFTFVVDFSQAGLSEIFGFIAACGAQTYDDFTLIAGAAAEHRVEIEAALAEAGVRAEVFHGTPRETMARLGEAAAGSDGDLLAVFLDPRVRPEPHFVEITPLAFDAATADAAFVWVESELTQSPLPCAMLPAAAAAVIGPLSPIFVMPRSGTGLRAPAFRPLMPRPHAYAPDRGDFDLRDMTSAWAGGWLRDAVWRHVATMGPNARIVCIRDHLLARWSVSDAEPISADSFSAVLRDIRAGEAILAAMRPSVPADRPAAQATPVWPLRPAKTRPDPSLLLCLPWRVTSNLSLRIFDAIHTSGTPCYITTQFPHPAGYAVDEGGWANRMERLFPLWRIAAQSVWPELLAHIIETRNVQTLLMAGSPDVYPLLPGLRRRFRHLRVFDQLFNPVGHTRRFLLHEPCFDGAIVESGEMERFLLERGVVPEKIARIPNGVDLNYFRREAVDQAAAASLRAKCGVGRAGRFVVGYVGRMSPEKNPHGFVEIARRLTARRDDVSILIAGAGPLEGALRSAAMAALPPERLHVHGFIDDVRVAMAACDVLVTPSILDGRPAALVEAAALGIPTVGSAVGGIPEVIVEGVTGCLFPVGNYDQAVAAIEAILAPGALDRMRADSRSHAVATVDEQIMFGAYHRLLAPWRFLPMQEEEAAA